MACEPYLCLALKVLFFCAYPLCFIVWWAQDVGGLTDGGLLLRLLWRPCGALTPEGVSLTGSGA